MARASKRESEQPINSDACGHIAARTGGIKLALALIHAALVIQICSLQFAHRKTIVGVDADFDPDPIIPPAAGATADAPASLLRSPSRSISTTLCFVCTCVQQYTDSTVVVCTTSTVCTWLFYGL